jgi:uncharacterized protein (TIGR04255 family)
VTSTASLPDYGKPPVVEVVFAVKTAPLPLTVVDLAKFGLDHLQEYPEKQEQPPMIMAIESFSPEEQNIAPSLALLSGPAPIRLWFQSSDRSKLVQLQKDWFAYNWQGASSETAYPRYGNIEERFFQTWDKWEAFAKSLELTDIPVTQCELTYINHIVPGSVWESQGQLDKVLRVAGRADGFLPEPEDGQVMFRYRMKDAERDAGRLYIQATPGIRSTDRSPLIQLILTARGAPAPNNRDGMLQFFRLAHMWIVNGFASATTEAAQDQLWERKR